MGLSRFTRFRGVTPVSQWLRGGSARIKSIQRGTIAIAGGATSNTATITSVDTANTRLVFLGILDASGDTTPDIVACRIALTNATTVTATVNTVGAGNRTVSYEVVEYFPGAIKTIQRGTFATTGSTTGTATISSVDTTRTTLDYLGFSTTFSGGTVVGQALGELVLTNATTVTFNGLGNQNRTVSYQVVEWA